MDFKLNKEKLKATFKEIDKEVTDCCGVEYVYRVGLYNGEPYFERWDFCPDCLECA